MNAGKGVAMRIIWGTRKFSRPCPKEIRRRGVFYTKKEQSYILRKQPEAQGESEKWVWERRLGSNHGGRWLSTGRVWTYPVNSGKPLNWVIDMTGAVLWGQVLLRSRGQDRRGCKTSLRARQEETEEEMDGKTFKKQHNLLTSTKMLNVHNIWSVLSPCGEDWGRYIVYIGAKCTEKRNHWNIACNKKTQTNCETT